MASAPEIPSSPPGRVFVTQETDLHLARATRFGQLVSMLPRQRTITLSPQPVMRKLREHLKDFSNDDHLLLVGDPLAMGLALVVAGQENNGLIRVLKWDRELKDYYSVQVDLHDRMRDNT